MILLVQKSQTTQPPFGWCAKTLVNKWFQLSIPQVVFERRISEPSMSRNSTPYKCHPPSHPSPNTADESVEFFSQLRQVLAILFIALSYLHRQVPLEKTQAFELSRIAGLEQQSTIRGQIGGKRDSGGLGFGFWVPLSKNPGWK